MQWPRYIVLLCLLVFHGWAWGGELDHCPWAHLTVGSKAWRTALREEARRREFERRPVSTSEVHLNTDLVSRIIPFVEKKGVRGEFEGARGVPISFVKFDHPHEKGVVVISHGFSESAHFYPELIFNLYERGYSVHVLDHRGHGRSGRLMGHRMPVFVEKFQDYVDDLKTFIDTQSRTSPDRRVLLLGHSMGGLVASRYAQQNPDGVERVALSAPLFSPNLRIIPDRLAELIANAGRMLGYARSYAFGQGERTVLRDGFEDNLLTGSRGRFLAKYRLFRDQAPEEKNNGATFGWLAEAIAACREGRCGGANMTMPVLVMKAGQDRVVRGSAIDDFASRLPNGRLLQFPEARHDLLAETDPIRDRALEHLFQFFEPGAIASPGPVDPKSPNPRR